VVRDVHRLGILDIRLYNTDRHSGNILVRKVSDLWIELKVVGTLRTVREAQGPTE
jgi:hypothetical protein